MSGKSRYRLVNLHRAVRFLIRVTLAIDQLLSVLEPMTNAHRLYLSFGEFQALAELQPLRHAQVFVPLEFRLQRLNLRRGERCPRPLLPLVVADRAAVFFLTVSIRACRGVGTTAAGARFCNDAAEKKKDKSRHVQPAGERNN